jgi:hypothetical protein
MIFTTLVSLNIFDFLRELSFNQDLKLMKQIEYIRFDDNRVKPDKFRMCIQINNKISKAIQR